MALMNCPQNIILLHKSSAIGYYNVMLEFPYFHLERSGGRGGGGGGGYVRRHDFYGWGWGLAPSETMPFSRWLQKVCSAQVY